MMRDAIIKSLNNVMYFIVLILLWKFCQSQSR